MRDQEQRITKFFSNAGIVRPLTVLRPCSLGRQLKQAEDSARLRVRRTAIGDFRSAVETAQVALELQKVRLRHCERCADCSQAAVA